MTDDFPKKMAVHGMLYDAPPVLWLPDTVHDMDPVPLLDLNLMPDDPMIGVALAGLFDAVSAAHYIGRGIKPLFSDLQGLPKYPWRSHCVSP